MTRCTRCGKDKPHNEFHRNASKPGGVERQCRDCAAERKLTLRYGITRDQYNQLLDAQGGICPICRRPPTGGPLVVDHLHASDPVRVRGLLCAKCNAALGLLRDDPAVMARAAKYLGSHAAA